MNYTLGDRGSLIILHLLQKLGVLAFWGGTIWYAIQLPVSRARFGIAFLGGAVIVYLLYEFEDVLTSGRYIRASLLGGMGVAMAIITVYMWQMYQTLINIRTGFNTNLDYALAVIAIGIIIYLTYREYGLPFVSVAGVSIIYAYYGMYFPSWLQHSGLTSQRILQTGLLDISGIYGNLTGIMATWISLFLLYAGLIQGYGAFDLIMRAARAAGRAIESGVAQAALVSSIAIGMVNGSATANTGITGSITIPTMKRNGIKAETAGAIEAVASSGGQIMPPVMGAAAFLIASLLSIPFTDVLVAGIIPALIFYIPVAFSVHYAVSHQLEEQKDDTEEFDVDVKSRWRVSWESIQFLLPFLVLLYTLGVLQYSIMYSALITNVAMLLTGFMFPVIRRRNIGSISDQLSQTLDGLERGAQTTAPIAIVIASIGMIIDILLTTGVPTKISLVIFEISGGVFFIAVVLALVISIILGMGMPTSAAYLIVALLVAPSLIRNFGIPELAVHFFVFYAAILSALTPPIAVGIVVATGIADSDFWKTTMEAFRIGFPVFLLPFLFMYHPEIVAAELSVSRLTTALTALAGMILLAYGANKHFPGIGWLKSVSFRLLFILVGVGTLFAPNLSTRAGALALGVIVYLVQSRQPTGFLTSEPEHQ